MPTKKIIRLRRRPWTLVQGRRRKDWSPATPDFTRQVSRTDEPGEAKREVSRRETKQFSEDGSCAGTTGFSLWGFIAGIAGITMLIGLIVFGFMIRAAGFSRQARFNIAIIYNVTSQYYTRNKVFPESLSALPRFYSVSAADRIYLDSSALTNGKYKGFSYALQSPKSNQVVISASPISFWPTGVEFGITEDGMLRSNTKNVDGIADTREEVLTWTVVNRYGNAKPKSP